MRAWRIRHLTPLWELRKYPGHYVSFSQVLGCTWASAPLTRPPVFPHSLVLLSEVLRKSWVKQCFHLCPHCLRLIIKSMCVLADSSLFLVWLVSKTLLFRVSHTMVASKWQNDNNAIWKATMRGNITLVQHKRSVETCLFVFPKLCYLIYTKSPEPFLIQKQMMDWWHLS